MEIIAIDDFLFNDGEETFLASKVSSVKDLCLVTGSFAKHKFQLTTEMEPDFFTGEPQRGHGPFFVISQALLDK